MPPPGECRIYAVWNLFDMLPYKRAVNGKNHIRRARRSCKVNGSNPSVCMSASHQGKMEGIRKHDVGHELCLTGDDLVAMD